MIRGGMTVGTGASLHYNRYYGNNTLPSKNTVFPSKLDGADASSNDLLYLAGKEGRSCGQ
jgi:hypothetical protein